MKGSQYRYLYQALIDRSVVHYQVQHLARNYDFGKQSRIAELIVHEVNRQVEEVERQLGIKRIRPFELYLRWRRCELALPLFKLEYLDPILSDTGSFVEARELVLAECRKVCLSAKAKMDHVELAGVVDPDSFVRHQARRKPPQWLLGPTACTEPLLSAQLRECIEAIKPVSVFQRIDALDTGAPCSLIRDLDQFVEVEAGKGPKVAKQIVEELITLRNVCCPRTPHLRSGEMPFLATSVNAHLSEEVATRFRRLRPVILTIWTKNELAARPWDEPLSEELQQRRIVRVCFEAYRQGGLLSLMDLQWIFQISKRKLSELIRAAERQCQIIVPTPGTILDAGRSMTHKDIVIELYLEGRTVREIAKLTYHSARSVDSYIDTFESVLILHLYRVPKKLMARILKKGISLIEEHLKLAERYLRDEEAIRRLVIGKEEMA